MKTGIKPMNPDGLSKNPAFSQLIVTQGKGKTIYIGGQDAVKSNGEIVGKGDIQAQTEQVMQNIQTALSACEATFDNVVKLTVFIVAGQNVGAAFQAAQKYMISASNPPTVTVVFVSALGNPDFLVEVDAIAFLPET
ncbi:RidA family protein [Runella sp.]|uniref:RidA family protein n=1 Tax=Runella sp. TaxID=1960881 RepID=UPI003D131BB0